MPRGWISGGLPAGWEDGLFPNQRAMDEQGTKGLEEERRLAYVGITRAERLATITFAGNRRLYGQWQSSLPSRFVDELPEEHVEVLTPPGSTAAAMVRPWHRSGSVQMHDR
ncbi:DNA helicase II, partial [marine sediment metagenome]